MPPLYSQRSRVRVQVKPAGRGEAGRTDGREARNTGRDDENRGEEKQGREESSLTREIKTETKTRAISTTLICAEDAPAGARLVFKFLASEWDAADQRKGAGGLYARGGGSEEREEPAAGAGEWRWG